MIVYLDMCTLKRPFDDQTQPRIAVETAAVLSILASISAGRLKSVRSAAHDLENDANPDFRRASAVAKWLGQLNPVERTPLAVRTSVERLSSSGLKLLDAYHLAWADYHGCDALITCDDRFVAGARNLEGQVKLRVLDPVAFVEEFVP